MRTQKERPGKSAFTPRATTATNSSSEAEPATSRPSSSSVCSTSACLTMARPAAASEPTAAACARLRATTATVSPRRERVSVTCWPELKVTSTSRWSPSGGTSPAISLSTVARSCPGETRAPHSPSKALLVVSRCRCASHSAAGCSSASKNAWKASWVRLGVSRMAWMSLFMRRRLVQVEDLRLADVRLRLVPGDLPDLPDDLRHPLRLAVDDVHRAEGEVVLLQLALEQLRVPHHRGERLVQLVCCGAGQRDDDRVPFGLLQAGLRVGQLALQLQLVAEVGVDAHGGRLPFALVEDGGGHVHRDALARLVDQLLAGDGEPAAPALVVAAQPGHHLAGDAGRVELADVERGQRLLGGVAEDGRRALVEEDDLPGEVGGDDRVHRGVDQPLQELLGVAQLLRHLPLHGDVAEGDDGGGRPLVDGRRADGEGDLAAGHRARRQVDLPARLA